ncbi:interferon-induced GTP-binding Mx3-like protein [Labeo rohita]|uniref:Interferon-induced GTP-binding Mx3-like protein n=1 Tax=Labeo rohita TaxID=84645 RepID=A0A498M265_LABRO|nr:interferon-induced GTP-binding Mx3-like protein [Labeo rohita]RXN14929.1 interferon-induced GTP-binding Mx3-like protein [Labeo rohita]
MRSKRGIYQGNTENINCYTVLTWMMLLTGKHLKAIFSFNHNAVQKSWFYQGKCQNSFSESQTNGAFHNHFMESVQPLIELIDSLRLIGIDKDIDLPSIAVVGDQSSGKSSVLEALSGVALPRGSAQNKLAGNTVGISDELITLEISSPDVCDLTLIDLPGITRVPVHGQPDDIADQIKNLILKYIAKSETIILVVVPCNVDIATTEALRMAQDADPDGYRTLVTTDVKKMIEMYNEKHRGRELLTFSEFCEFESVIKDHVADLQEPAIATLKKVRDTYHVQEACCKAAFPLMKMIHDIQSKQEAKVEKRIKEFIDMEQLVFTQDKVLQKKLVNSDIPERAQMDSGDENPNANDCYDEDKIYNSKGCALLDSRNFVPDKLVLYYEIVYQRLTDYVPMLIILFMLKDAAKILRHQMLELRNGADVVKLLSEDSDQGRKRVDLKQRLERLKQAQELISSRI